MSVEPILTVSFNFLEGRPNSYCNMCAMNHCVYGAMDYLFTKEKEGGGDGWELDRERSREGEVCWRSMWNPTCLSYLLESWSIKHGKIKKYFLSSIPTHPCLFYFQILRSKHNLGKDGSFTSHDIRVGTWWNSWDLVLNIALIKYLFQDSIQIRFLHNLSEKKKEEK